MSNRRPPISGTATVVVVAVMFCFTIAAAAAIFIAVPEGANTGSLVTILVAALPAAIASVVNLTRTASVEDKVDDLGNGAMDAKLRAAVADVVRPEHLRDDAHDQLIVDRARRAAGYSRSGRAPVPIDPPASPTTGEDIA